MKKLIAGGRGFGVSKIVSCLSQSKYNIYLIRNCHIGNKEEQRQHQYKQGRERAPGRMLTWVEVHWRGVKSGDLIRTSIKE